MEEITLSDTKKQALEERHKACRDKRECDRIKAVLLANEDWSPKLIAQALRKHEARIKRYLTDFACHQKLTENRGGSDGYLNKEQTDQLLEHLCEKTYLNQHEIVAYIKETFSVSYTIPGLNKWLHQHDFSYKQPKAVPHKFDEDKQAQFIDDYTALKASLSEDEPLLFMDAAHPTQATKITAGWIKKGVDKPIETTGSRTRLNVIGAIELNHLSRAVIHHADNVNSDTMIEFFQQIRAQYSTSKTLHLVLDGAGYHKAKTVQEAAKKTQYKATYITPIQP